MKGGMDVENVSNGLRSKNMALAGSRNREHESVVSSASQVRCSDLTFTREVQQDCTHRELNGTWRTVLVVRILCCQRQQRSSELEKA
jgi:hypothetical protein